MGHHPGAKVHPFTPGFRYRSTTGWEAAWSSASYDTRELVRAWFIIEPFSKLEGLAHTRVSLEFAQDRFLTFSVPSHWD